jgi:hypothetical protein
MQGTYIMTLADITENRRKEDAIHMGSHFIDSHHVARYAVDQEHFINEGRIWQKGVCFDIPYRALVPRKTECRNLLVPVAVSASNVAFCAIRLEPTWMHLGEVAGMAAGMAVAKNQSVQDVDVTELRHKIRSAGIPLDLPLDPLPMVEGDATWIKTFFEQTDANQDGRVNLQEWLETKAEYEWLFGFVDQNNDEHIDHAEYTAFQAYKKKHPDWRRQLQAK